MADLVITAANVQPGSNAVKKTRVAGEAITAGQPVVRNPTTGLMMVADSNGASAYLKAVDGIALHAAANGQPLTYQESGDIDLGATLAVGVVYALSETAGGIQPTADIASAEFVTTLGIATAADNLALNIQNSGVAKA